MKTSKSQNETSLTVHGEELGLPITYHSAVEEAFDGWAEDCGTKPDRLRHATEEAIRNRHHEARVKSPACGPFIGSRGGHPDVYELRLDSCTVFYSIQATAVMVRGYGWEIEGDPLDDFDGGGFYCD